MLYNKKLFYVNAKIFKGTKGPGILSGELKEKS